MKLKIKVKKINKNIELPSVINKGEWVDLRASKSTEIGAPKRVPTNKRTVTMEFDSWMIPLGIAARLPEGFEAIIAPRSSTYMNYGIMQTNSLGIIDNSYSGNNDEWKMPVIGLKSGYIPEGERVCQFRIQLSQKATVWQKLKWLFCSGIKLIEVEDLKGFDRGGFGSTGRN